MTPPTWAYARTPRRSMTPPTWAYPEHRTHNVGERTSGVANRGLSATKQYDDQAQGTGKRQGENRRDDRDAAEAEAVNYYHFGS